jgi:hypothetical protein
MITRRLQTYTNLISREPSDDLNNVFFKVKYRRYKNFAMERCVHDTNNGQINKNKKKENETNGIVESKEINENRETYERIIPIQHLFTHPYIY